MLKNVLLFLSFFISCGVLISDEKLSSANLIRKNIREALKIEIQISKENAKWQREQEALLLDKKLLELQLKKLIKLNAKHKKLAEDQKNKLEVENKVYQSLLQKHQIIFNEIQKSVSQLDEVKNQTPGEKEIHSMVGTLKQSVNGKHEDKDISFLFDQLNDFHGQLWQMGQSTSIKEATISISTKQYHGDLIRLGLVYQFLIFKDRSRWAYLHAKSKTWKFGKKDDLHKVITLYKVLAKKEPLKIIQLPKMDDD